MQNLRAVLPALCLALTLEAQVPGITVTTQPPEPTATTPVTVVIRSQCACPTHLTPINQNGFTLEVPYNFVCLSGCLPDSVATYEVGTLSEGVYTVRQHPNGDPASLTTIGTFTVRNASMSFLESKVALAILGGLAGLGLIAALLAWKR